MDWVFVIIFGLFAAAAANLATYRFRYEPRGFSPWNGLGNTLANLLGCETVPTIPEQSPKEKKRRRKDQKNKPLPELGKRTWLDAVPILGWWQLRREEPLQGSRFWVRPLWVEILLPVGFVLLYWWLVIGQNNIANPRGFPFPPLRTTEVQHIFVGSALLILFMLVASLIDLDEYLIPDEVIIPGTILGIIWVTAVASTPLSMVVGPPKLPLVRAEYVSFSHPQAWPDFLTQASPLSLLTGIGCVCLWCFALMERKWNLSRGLPFAIWRFFVRLRRAWSTKLMCTLAVIGSAAVFAMWRWGGAEAWQALMTSLLGMIIGMIIIWTVRIVAGLAIGIEAMGFGDVTLMGMIGAFLGWQACVFVFFCSPFFALVPALASAISRRTTTHPIPYGPFLCLGAVAVVVFWRGIWEWGLPMFEIGWFLPAVLLLCIPMLAILLGMWRLTRFLLTRNQSQRDGKRG